jgi:hypothetical protein
MGLTNFKGEIPSKKEAETAKNYLTKDELDMLIIFSEYRCLKR